MVVMTHLTYQKTTMLGLNSFLLSISAPYQDQARRRVIQLRDQYEGLFVSTIAEGIESGEFRETGARFAAKPLLGALNYAAPWSDKIGRASVRERVGQYG